MNYLYICSILASLLAVFGILLRQWSHGSCGRMPDPCYVLGCFCGLLLFVAQIYLLVLPFGDSQILPDAARDDHFGRRQLLDDISSPSTTSFHSLQRQLQSSGRSGFCADNDDWDAEPDVICPEPTWLQRHASGRSKEECCSCSSTTLQTPRAFCVDTNNLESDEATDYERVDVCSAVMRYAKCGRPLLSGRIDIRSIQECASEEHEQGYPGGPGSWITTNIELRNRCSRCYEDSYKQGSFAALANDFPDAMQSLCMQTAADISAVDTCTYEFRLLTAEEQCNDNYCSSTIDARGDVVGNSVYQEGDLENQPVVSDVQCESPARLRSPGTVGRTPEDCCETVGMCIGNTDPDTEPDVTCTEPGFALKPDALHTPGRNPEACCVKTGRCVGNTDVVAEPDFVCAFPSTAKPASTIGRNTEECCYTTGMCSDNSDPAEDVDCEALGLGGRTLKSNSAAISRGDDGRQCCECRGSSTSASVARPDAWCVPSQADGSSATDHLQNADVAAADNSRCSQVMKYAACRESIFDSCSTCVTDPGYASAHASLCAECEECAEEYPYPSWQTIADDSLGQLRCMEEDRGETAANRYQCTYIFRRFEELREGETCIDNMCIANTDPDIDPDVTCSNGLQLLPNAERKVGRTEQECCVVTGQCAGNTDAQTEPDVVCPFPSRLTDEVGAVGRDEASCCITSGMCAGNSLSTGEPDVVCLPPLRALQGLELIAGRSTASCCERVGYCTGNDAPEVEDVVCPQPTSLIDNAESVAGRTPETCCVRTGLCVGNIDTIAEPDIVCSAPAVLRDDAADRIGRDADAYGPCCEVTGMCAGNSDTNSEPDVVCGGAWTLVDNATIVPRGSLEEQAWRCCHTVCPGAESISVCQCGEMGAEKMTATAGQIFVLVLIGVVLAILRVSAACHQSLMLAVARNYLSFCTPGLAGMRSGPRCSR